MTCHSGFSCEELYAYCPTKVKGVRMPNMPRRKKPLLCPLHLRALPCLSCRGVKGGSVSSKKKTAANRKKAKAAANARWNKFRTILG